MSKNESNSPLEDQEPLESTTEDAVDSAIQSDVFDNQQDEELTKEEKVQLELAEAKEQALRTQAELENFRKRIYREMEEQRKFANMDIMRELLPVWDNMGRAIEAAEKAGESTGLLDGVKMVSQLFLDVLEKHHCKQIEAVGQPFDPNMHEAILQQPSDDQPENTILLETETGFQLHDRIVRPSKVIVSKSTSEAE